MLRKLLITAAILAALLLLLGSAQPGGAGSPALAAQPLPGPSGPLSTTLHLPAGVNTTLAPAALAEGFEGAWPSAGWALADQSTIDGGEFLLGARDCHPHAGARAGWVVGGGADGAALACGSDYATDLDTWAVYGPFSLVGATQATLSFYLYGICESETDCPYDALIVGSSIDGSNVQAQRYCGDYTTGPDGAGYTRIELDLADRLGQSQVWIAFGFATDGSIAFEGFMLDDIALDVSGGTAPTATHTPLAGATATRTSSAVATATRTASAGPTSTHTPQPGGLRRVSLPLVMKAHRLPEGILRDSRGRPASALGRSEALYADFSGLVARTQYDVQVLDPSQAELTLSRFTTDGTGNIPTSALAYDLGLTQGAPGSPASLSAVGRHTVIVRGLDGREERRWFFDLTEPTGPIVYAANAQGAASNSFLVNAHIVHARGERLPPGAQVSVYVVPDRSDWVVGTPLGDVSGGANPVTVGGDGRFLVQVWGAPNAIGAYDIVVDVDRNGVYSAADVVDSYSPVGFMVQRAGTGVDIQVQLACDARLNYKDVFLANENVYIYVNPPVQQFAHMFGYKYVVRHRDVWNTGDDLVDITEGPERDHPQYGCTNEGRVLIWPAPLTSGIYDVIFDINHNGRYDKGIDLLDNIDAFGNAVGGFFVPGAPGAPLVRITSPANGSTSTDGVIDLLGTVTSLEPVTWARWYVNAGTQSASGELGLVATQFNQRVYLFPGQNTVQVWARNASGTGTGSIVVYSGVSGVWDIHAQLVWPTKGQDFDLHLLRPQGSRTTVGDCYYGNCRNARAGNPDWGVAGLADDNPRLDVDCTSQCAGPENITLATLAHPSGNGRYTVEVYYYSDHGLGAGQPRVNLWVRGRLYTFGPVTLTNRQWWTVCTVDLPSGLVTPSGVIAARPLAAEEGAPERFPAK